MIEVDEEDETKSKGKGEKTRGLYSCRIDGGGYCPEDCGK